MVQKPDIKIMRERCVECGDCVTLCPQSIDESPFPVFRLSGELGVEVLHEESCIACFTCVEYCRAAAIVIHPDRFAEEDQPEIFPSRPVVRII